MTLGLALGVVLAVLVGWGLLTSVRDFWYPRPDSARYLLAARSLADGEGYTLMGEPFRLRPPGFGAMLAPLVALRGYDFELLHTFVSLFGVAAVVLLYVLLLPRVGAPVAFAAAVATAAYPGFRALCNQVLSDVPGLALTLLALVVLRWADRHPSFARDAVVGLVIAAAAYVRSACLLLLPALVLHRAAQVLWPASPAGGTAVAPRVVRQTALPLALVAVLYLPWALQPAAPQGILSPYLHSYRTALLRSDPSDPSSDPVGAGMWLARVLDNGRAYAGVFASGKRVKELGTPEVVLAAAGVLGLLVTLVRRREAPEWLACGTIAFLLVYFEWAPRLLLTAFVLTLGAMVDAARWLGTRVAPRALADGALVAILAVIAFTWWSTGAGNENGRKRYDELLAATHHLDRMVPRDAAIAGDLGIVYATLLERPVHSLGPLVRRGKPEEAEALFVQTRPAALLARLRGPLAKMVQRLAAEGHPVFRYGAYVVVDLSTGAGPREATASPPGAASTPGS